MFKFYEVGGCVRDELLGIKSKDIDYVAVPTPDILKIVGDNTAVMFELLQKQLEADKYEIFLVTDAMYTIRAKFPKEHKHTGVVADFVMARKEIGYKEGTREPIVVPGTLLDDLQRRDFTVNAIAKDERGSYIDPFSGRLDIQRKLLRTPIHPDITFEDDPLRLLRAIRFSITKKFDIDVPIARIIRSFDYKNKFHVVSEDRIREELHKCFKADTYLTLLKLEIYTALTRYIFSNTKIWLKPTNEQ